MTSASTRVPTREEAIEAAAEIYLEAKIRIETERLTRATPTPTREEAVAAAAEVAFEAIMRIETEKAVAALQQENAPAGQGEGEDQNTSQENRS